MDRAVSRASVGLALGALGLLALAGLASEARGALPPRHGGLLTLPAPEPVHEVDPARVRSHFEATLVEAIFDGLYELDEGGGVRPVLAAGPPEREGTVVRIPLRAGVRHHGGARPVAARHVVRSLMRTTTAPQASWLLGAFEFENGRPLIREVDDQTVEITLARRGLRVDMLLAASPLRIVVGGSLRRRPLGTGAFRARLDGQGGADLLIFRHAIDRAPWMNHVRFVAPQPRDDELRAFELGELDGSWQGRSLYGREPTRPVTTTEGTAITPWLLVPNRARGLRDDDAWGAVAAALDRRRLARVGLVPRRTLASGLPRPTIPRAGRIRRGIELRLPVHAERPFELRLAEAVAGMLDERGIRLSVDRLNESRYAQAIGRGQWDLRLAMVRPPLPGRGPMVGAALAAAGQLDRARQLATELTDVEVAASNARRLDCAVLGFQRLVLHHRADLVGVRIDARGRLGLADLSRARRPEPFR